MALSRVSTQDNSANEWKSVWELETFDVELHPDILYQKLETGE